ncbi:uncharacterized protein V1510DRAFT_414521 [Dipodascopsis tothii]|uniref:uncharacterized protein n=1 Tax=Dipodascopsis tothii TaxID=44089 RepID=UPI0034CF46F3
MGPPSRTRRALVALAGAAALAAGVAAYYYRAGPRAPGPRPLVVVVYSEKLVRPGVLDADVRHRARLVILVPPGANAHGAAAYVDDEAAVIGFDTAAALKHVVRHLAVEHDGRLTVAVHRDHAADLGPDVARYVDRLVVLEPDAEEATWRRDVVRE